MKRRGKTAFLTIIAFIAIICLIYSAKYFSAKFENKIEAGDNSADISVPEKYDVLNIECVGGNLQLIGGEYDDISYEVNGAIDNVERTVTGNTLVLSSKTSDKDFLLTVYVPTDYFNENADKINIKSVSASVAIDGLTLKHIKIDITSGNITVDESNIYDMNILLRSGKVNISDSYMKVLQAEITSGDINVKGQLDESYISVISGNVLVDCEKDIKRADISVNAGNTKLFISNDDVSFYIENYSESFTCNRDLAFDGECYRLGSGDVPISLINHSGSINITVK